VHKSASARARRLDFYTPLSGSIRGIVTNALNK
jgi:hypothetical protein